MGLFQAILAAVKCVVTAPLASSLEPKPKHIRFAIIGDSVDDCLRKIERRAGLPKGDLSICDVRRDQMAFPAMREGRTYIIASKTSELWRNAGTGYIVCDVFETTKPAKHTQAELGRMNYDVAVALSCDYVCLGSIHVSENCPGVYQNNRCMTCGDISN